MEPVKDAKVAVVGGRDFDNYCYLKDVLDRYREKHGISFIVSGGATGADTFAESYARTNEISFTVFVAKWSKYGKRAGPRRNLKIAECADVMIAFPTKASKGTWNAVDLMKKLGKPVYVFDGTRMLWRKK
jgi:predicted Rossmann fold nucleotide-binding protein DprA/Smf involved in DNA uptake